MKYDNLRPVSDDYAQQVFRLHAMFSDPAPEPADEAKQYAIGTCRRCECQFGYRVHDHGGGLPPRFCKGCVRGWKPRRG